MELAEQLDLFALEESEVSVFQIFPGEATNRPLRDWIELAGGVVIEANDDDPYKIVVVDIDWFHNVEKVVVPTKFPVKVDVFSPFFVYDSYTKNKVQDLNQYRIGNSLFQPYNANDVLHRKTSWAQLVRQVSNLQVPLQVGRRNGDVKRIHCGDKPGNSSNSSEGTNNRNDINIKRVHAEPTSRNFQKRPQIPQSHAGNPEEKREVHVPDDDESELESTATSTVTAWSWRIYTHEEEQRIVDFICSNNYFSFTGGNRVWEKMSATCDGLKDRSHQSLKERFRKKILPNLKKFNISKENLRKFELAQAERRRGRRKAAQI